MSQIFYVSFFLERTKAKLGGPYGGRTLCYLSWPLAEHLWVSLVLFTEARPQSPFLSKIIGMRGDLEDQLMYVFQLLYKNTVAVIAPGL